MITHTATRLLGLLNKGEVTAEALTADFLAAIRRLDLADARAQGLLETFDATPAYDKQIDRLVDLDRLRGAGIKVVADSMYGTGQGYFKRLLSGGSTRVDEMRNFAPAQSQQVFPFCGKNLALTICEDAWNDKQFWNKRLYTFDPVEALVQAGGNFVLNISASPFWVGKRELRRDMLATIARHHRAPVAMVNQVGGNDSLVFDGSSLVIDPAGNVIAQGKSFEEDLIYFDPDALTWLATSMLAHHKHKSEGG